VGVFFSEHSVVARSHNSSTIVYSVFASVDKALHHSICLSSAGRSLSYQDDNCRVPMLIVNLSLSPLTVSGKQKSFQYSSLSKVLRSYIQRLL